MYSLPHLINHIYILLSESWLMIWLSRRRINKSPMTLEDPEKSFLKKSLTTPPVKKIDLHFPLGLEVTARNMKGVTIKDAVDAIYKQFRKKVCDPFAFFTPPPSSYTSPSSHPPLSSHPHLILFICHPLINILTIFTIRPMMN